MWTIKATALLSLVCLSSFCTAAQPCDESGYCSSASVQPYFGDIFSGEGLKLALQARSYRQEVILMVADRKRVDGFLQGARSLHSLGLEHILLLSLTESECIVVNAAVPVVGCGWTTFQSPDDLEGVYDMWNLRYRTVARSIRLGYNVLLLDSDVIIFDDPYKYLKQSPFKDMVVINQEENRVASNGGVLYVQNAAPDGPAAFMFTEIVSRPLRWADDDWAHANELTLHKTCMYADQDAYADVLADMVSGYMLFPKSWYCLDQVPLQEVRQEPKWLQVYEEMGKHARLEEAFREVEHKVPESWQHVTGGPTMTLRSLDMRMPNCRGWPEELGGQWYPAERGRFSKELLQQLHDDCPDCPMWPDAEDASKAMAADKVPKEKFAMMPHWLGISYWIRGRQGYWDAQFTGTGAQQVIAHTHYNPIADTHIHKYVVPMSLGLYDWDLATRAKGNALYTACASDSCSELKVLAFTPAMERLVGSSASWQEYAFLLRGLAHLASLLGRAVAWPSLPCSTPWVNLGHQTAKPPLDLGQMWLPWTAADGQLMCTPWEVARWACLSDGAGLMPWEWLHFQQQHHQDNSSAAGLNSSTADITLQAVHAEQEGNSAVAEPGYNLTQHVVEINDTDELKVLDVLADQQIVFLNNLVHTDLDNPKGFGKQSEAYQSLLKRCTMLNTSAIAEKYSFNSWNFGAFQGLKVVDGAATEIAEKPQRLKRGKLHRHLHLAGHTRYVIKHSVKKHVSVL